MRGQTERYVDTNTKVRVIAHVHGRGQVAVSVFELDLAAFKSKRDEETTKALKTWPAGYEGRRH